VTDKTTKQAVFEPWKEEFGLEHLAYLFLKAIYKLQSLPTKIISDRGTVFDSKFWLTLSAKLGIKNKMSTAYHPQTDGQTEWLNQTLEQYLRCFINYKQNNWVEYLPTAEFTYNSTKYATTGKLPFNMMYGYNLLTFYKPYSTKHWEQKASLDVEKLKILHKQVQADLDFINQRTAYYYNAHHGKEPNLKKGDRVYLLRRNITTKWPNEKLNFKKLGPFIILKRNLT